MIKSSQKLSNDSIQPINRLNSDNPLDSFDKVMAQSKTFQKSKFESSQMKNSLNVQQQNNDNLGLKSPNQQSQLGLTGFSFDQKSIQFNTPMTNSINVQALIPNKNLDYVKESSQIVTQNENSFLQGRHRRNPANQNLNNMDSSIMNPFEEPRNRLQIQQSSSINNQNNSINLSTPQNKASGEFKAIKRQLSRTNSIDFQEQEKDIKDQEPKNLSIFRREKQQSDNQPMKIEDLNKSSQILQIPVQQNNQKKIDFADGDEYFFFDPKSKIKDLVPQQNSIGGDNGSPKNQMLPKKRILKLPGQGSPKGLKLSKGDSQKIKRLKSSSDIDKKPSTQRTIPVKSDSVLDSVCNDDDIEQQQRDSLQIASPLPLNMKNMINMRQRTAIIFSDSNENMQTLFNNALINKLQLNSKNKILSDYEKASYMRRSSDIKRLIEFQKRKSNQITKKLVQLIETFYNIMISLLTLNAFKVQINKTCNIIRQVQVEVLNIFFNLSLISIFVFLYAIIQLYQSSTPQTANSDELKSKLFLSNLSGYLTYSGHFFIFIFILAFIKLSSSIRDFSMDKKKQGFLLVFSEYRWNGKQQQLKCLAKKFKWIDQIYENIDTNEHLNLNQQQIILWILEISLLFVDVACLYFILDDSYLLATALEFTSNNILSRFIVSIITSLLLQANSYVLQIMVSCFSEIDFYFYEKMKYSFIFFNQMFILIIYQIKIMAYLNAEYKPSSIQLKLSDNYEISYINLALIVSEFAIFLLEMCIIKIIQAVRSFLNKSSKSNINLNQILPIQNNVDSNQAKQSQQQFNTFITKEDNSNEQIVNKRDPNKSETNSVRNNSKQETQLRQNTIVQLKCFSESLNAKACQQNSSKIVKNTYEENVQGSYKLIKESIFMVSINYLILSNSILQPSIFIVGLVLNTILKIIQDQESKRVLNYLSNFNYSQFNSLLSLTSLIALLISFFFNFVVGFNVLPQNSSYMTLYSYEFSYIFDIQRINSIIKIITLPYLLFPIIILLLVLLIQQNQFHKNHENIFRDSYYKLKHSQNSKKQE